MDVQFRPFVFARQIFRLVLLCTLFLSASAVTLGQSTASLNGTVTDPSGGAVPNVKVTATNQATGVVSATQTDDAGAYLFPSLPIGVYRLDVKVSGSSRQIQLALKLLF